MSEAENPEIKEIRATFLERTGAVVIDALILAPLYILHTFVSSSQKALALLALQVLLSFFYIGFYFYFELRYQATPGKMITGLRVDFLQEKDVKTLAIRHLPYLMPSISVIGEDISLVLLSVVIPVYLPLAIAWILSMVWFAYILYNYFSYFGHDKRTLHDRMSKTQIVSLKRLNTNSVTG